MTRQITDKLIYEGKDYYLNEEILEYYFNEFPDKKPEFNGFMTALWRGYVATFEVKDKELLITDIDWFSVKQNFSPADFMKINFTNNKYSWFSGLIRIDAFRGDFDDETNENAIYELLEFNKGNLVKHWTLNYPEFLAFKEILFEDFEKTKDYEKLFDLWRTNNPHLEKKGIDKYIYQFLIRNVREL